MLPTLLISKVSITGWRGMSALPAGTLRGILRQRTGRDKPGLLQTLIATHRTMSKQRKRITISQIVEHCVCDGECVMVSVRV
jgi:hypothetical protein